MKPQPAEVDCQIGCLRLAAEGPGELPPQTLLRRLKLAVRRRLTPQVERRIKSYSNSLANLFSRLAGKETRPLAAEAFKPISHLQAGDRVRVRSKAEIEATLNHWRQLRGCSFMREMTRYCETTQLVLKPLRRFVDERDLRVKEARGIVLLEGVACEGTADFGQCDRSCLIFWREEWLERLEAPTGKNLTSQGAACEHENGR